MTKITYEDLRKCAELAKEAEDIRERLERLSSILERCTPSWTDAPVHASGISPDKIGEYTGELIKLEAEGLRRSEAYLEHVFEVDKAIGEIEDPTQRMILRLRYLDGRTWRDISDKTHYVESWCRKLCLAGVESMGIELPTPRRAEKSALNDL